MREKRHEREAEDAQFKLQSANQALTVKDQEAQRLESSLVCKIPSGLISLLLRRGGGYSS